MYGPLLRRPGWSPSFHKHEDYATQVVDESISRWKYSAFSGADIKCTIFIPQETDATQGSESDKTGLKTFAELQTITVSSARTVGPVRILGQAEAINHVRGPRTVAGTMIFTDIMKDVFYEVLQMSVYERGTGQKFFVDQLPPFNVIITALNEMGIHATRAVIGVTLVNYGTTYSIDDMLTESQYTYQALGVTPFMRSDRWRQHVRKALNATPEAMQQTRASTFMRNPLTKYIGEALQ